MKIGSVRWKSEYGDTLDEASNLEIKGCRMTLYTIGEGSMPLGEVAEVYLQRASEIFKDIVRDFPTEDLKTGVEYHMFINGNVYKPLLKDKYHEREWEHDTRTNEEVQRETEELRKALYATEQDE